MNELVEKFLGGTLSDAEEAQLKQLLEKDNSPEAMRLRKYFEWTSAEQRPVFSLSPEKIFSEIERRERLRNKQTTWIKIAATLLLVCLAAVFVVTYRPATDKKYSDEEVQRSLQATKLALASMADHLKKGRKNLPRGLDFSMPFDALEKKKKNSKPIKQ